MREVFFINYCGTLNLIPNETIMQRSCRNYRLQPASFANGLVQPERQIIQTVPAASASGRDTWAKSQA